jgi:alpha-L-arabinofuranosidase
VNTHAHDTVAMNCKLAGVDATQASGRILTADTLDAHNTFDKPEQVKPAEFRDCSVSGGTLKVSLPPHSLVVLTLAK